MSILSILWQSLTITLFVLSMMLIIDYLNVFSKGLWSKNIRKKPITQIVLGALLGIIPGCLGAYTAVSLYVHNIFGKGALVAAMIATSGDEAFFMYSIIPKQAIFIHLLLFIIALLTGFAVNRFTRKEFNLKSVKHFEIHEEHHEKINFSVREITKQLMAGSSIRWISMISIVIAIVLVALNFEHILEGFGSMNHDQETKQHLHPEWIGITFLVVLSASLFVILTVKNHFIKEHLWNHVVKKHFIRIFLWTFFTLLFIHIIAHYVDIESFIGQNLFIILIIAVLVGIIPESGPHFIFIVLFASGNLPFSILLANSIVQDGHGSLPLLAESQRNFFIVKAINLLVGFFIGLLGILIGF